MAKKSDYQCILYEVGDKVMLKDSHGSSEIKEIESADFKYVGIYPTQFLKFKDKPVNICDLSNFYVPAAETIEKYKDGLVYYKEEKITSKKEKSAAVSDKAHERLTGAIKRARNKDNKLTEEDLKPVYFNPNPNKKKDADENK